MEDYKKYLPVPMETVNCFEVWWPVKEYEGIYEVSNIGRVKSLKYGKEKILKLRKKDKGYRQVQLCKYGRIEQPLVHRLVTQAFLGECHDGYEVDHQNTVRSDNRLLNLRYVTHNEQYSKNVITKQKHVEAMRKLAQNQEWRKNQAEAAKIRSENPEWRRKHAENLEKLHTNPEWRKKNAENLKKLHSDQEFRKKHAEAMRKLAQDPEWRKKNAETMKKYKSKPVNQYSLDGEFVRTWASAMDAERELGISHANISECCNRKRKSAGGFIWRHKEVA